MFPVEVAAKAVRRALSAVTFVLAGVLLIGLITAPNIAEAQERLNRTVKIGSVTRTYAVYLPSGVATKTNLRVMIAYHPAMNTSTVMVEGTKLHASTGSENFVVVYPDGYKQTWNAGACCGAAKLAKIDEVAFFKAIMADVAKLASVRPKAYVTGYSNGALMVYQLMCKVPDQLAAAAPFAAYLATDMMTGCVTGTVPLMHIHGDSDTSSPVDGGMTSYLGVLPPARDTVQAIAKKNACATTTRYRTVTELGTDCVTYDGAASCETSLCVIPGLGHVWPGMKPQSTKLGPARPDLQGSVAIINFFNRH